MRRAIAISLMMLFSWTLIAPLVAADAGSNLPACCRKHAKCHCGMCRRGHRPANPKGLATVAGKCPCNQAGASTPASSTCKPEPGGAHHAEAAFHPALASPTGGYTRITFLRAHPKRGPPIPRA
jgi:hypothetical protein